MQQKTLSDNIKEDLTFRCRSDPSRVWLTWPCKDIKWNRDSRSLVITGKCQEGSCKDAELKVYPYQR